VSWPSALASEWTLHVFQMAAQGGVVALLLVPAAAALRRSAPALRSALLSVALAKFVLPPMLPFPTGVFSRFAAAPQAFFSRTGLRACAVFAVIHAAGFAVAFARLAGARRRTRAWLRRSAPYRPPGAGPEVRISRDAAVPCALGGRRPAILLPERLVDTLDAVELDAVIRHEREHLARRDPAVTVFEAFVAAFWWFHPAVRALLSRRRELREERCDDAVVACVPPDAYRRALLSAASLALPGRFPAVAATGPAAELRRRLERIADPELRSRKRALAAALAVAAAAVLLLPGVHPRVGPGIPVARISR